MALSTSSMTNLLVKHWADRAEQVVYVFGNDERAGYVASTVGGVNQVPHVIAGPTIRIAEQHRTCPAPMKTLRDGAFLGDELVHDPGLWGFAQATAPTELAVRFADALMASGSISFLAVTSHRIGVLVETAHLESEQAEPAAASSSFSLMGVAKSVARGVKSRDERTANSPVTSACEAQMSAIREIVPVPMGRSGKPLRFLRFRFHDGSTLDLKHVRAEQLAETIHLNLR